LACSAETLTGDVAALVLLHFLASRQLRAVRVHALRHGSF